MSSQQRQPSSDRRCLAADKLGVVGGMVEVGAHIRVAKPVQHKLSTINNGQELSVCFSKGVERAVAATIPSNRLTYANCFLGQRSRNMHCRQRPQVTVGSRSADFGPPMQIGHAAPQNTPGVLASRIAFRARQIRKSLGSLMVASVRSTLPLS